ncbi:MAG: class I SAM-dependent RNA methyltransferase [Bradymonadales bacterium]|nr:class I SAM-dependent RNA methyltransferase [Bradymonadales bacterium]
MSQTKCTVAQTRSSKEHKPAGDREPTFPHAPSDPLARTDLVPIQIERLAFGGDGLGHLEGMVVFVPGTLPAETVLVEPSRSSGRFLRARCAAILQQSPLRRPLDCLHEFAEGCGGCGFRHVNDEVSLQLKLEAALSSMERLAADVRWPRPRIHTATRLDGQRVRAKFHGQGGRLGFYRRSSHSLVSVFGCRALHPRLLEGVNLLESALTSDRSAPTPSIALLEIVDQPPDGLPLRFASLEGPSSEAQREALQELVDSASFHGIRLRQRHHLLQLGETWIEERFTIRDVHLELRRRLGTFSQTNPETNQAIRLRLHEILQDLRPPALLELFAGSGNLSLVAALSCPRVLAVEGDPEAVEGLQSSAQASGLPHLRAIRRDLTRSLHPLVEKANPDLILLDPPRAGAAEILPDLLRSGASDILYLSCSPPHLARDLARLAGSYTLYSLDAFDMFPRTPHLELLAWLVRR